MHIVVFCATRRGYLFLRRLMSLVPDDRITVFSFKEDKWEPPFFNDICSLAKEEKIQVIEAKNVGNERLKEFWSSTEIDLMLAVSWRYLVPENVRSVASKGAYVFHDSLLPEYRGFSPTVWAIMNGEKYTGATLFEMVEEVDSGGIVDQKTITIGTDESISDVMERVTEAYLQLLEDNIRGLLGGSPGLVRQDEARATYTCKLIPQDFEIDWSRTAEDIHNFVRAYTKPYPGAFTYLSGKRLKIWKTSVYTGHRQFVGTIPGRIAMCDRGSGIVVCTGKGLLKIDEVELEGQKPTRADLLVKNISYTLGRN